MNTLTQASREWMSRPDDERFASLTELLDHFRHQRSISRQEVVSTSILEARPVAEDEEHKGLVLLGADEAPAFMSHHSFGQLATLAKAPAGYLRTLPADIAADNLNFGLRFARDADEIGTLVRKNGGLGQLAAATGPGYGRIWNVDVAQELVNRFGDGVTGDFTAPGIFGKALDPTDVAEYRRQACYFASDRDMFVFLCDEKNRIEVPNRRNGEPGSLARGFFVWNSEVGYTSLGVAMFLFDYVCMNRMVWGVEGYQEIRIRHSSGAPGRYLNEIVPVIESFANSPTTGISDAIANAQMKRIAKKDEEITDWLTDRLKNRTMAKAVSLVHMNEEQRPIETLWDASVGITAYARELKNQDERVNLEREAGKILQLAQ